MDFPDDLFEVPRDHLIRLPGLLSLNPPEGACNGIAVDFEELMFTSLEVRAVWDLAQWHCAADIDGHPGRRVTDEDVLNITAPVDHAPKRKSCSVVQAQCEHMALAAQVATHDMPRTAGADHWGNH